MLHIIAYISMLCKQYIGHCPSPTRLLARDLEMLIP
jgi:hypothetical protein